jgi:hypothetical protein
MDPTQTGGGLSFANALGISYSQSQVRGAPSGGGTDVFSTVTLLLNGNLISAEPGDSSVNIADSITGQNVQYISQMAGTTMINSPTMVNGNLVLPHQYNFSMNPEQSAGTPTATINANLNVGTSTLNPDIILYPNVFNVASGDTVFSGDSLSATCSTIGFTASNITITTSSITTIASSITTNTPTATTNTTTAQTNTTVYVLSSQTAYISSDQNLSISTNSGSINMNAASNVNINSSGSNVNIESYYITNVKGSDVNVVADSGLSAFNTPIVNITAQNGPLGGLINLNSYASYGEVAGYGRVSINAHGSTNNPAVPIGGSIDINAFSAGLNTFAGATSAIRLNAATININAGAIPSFPTLAGSMVMFGNNIVSICAGSPAVFPQIPLTTYLYGLAGLRLDCGTGARVTSLGIFQAPNVELDIIRANSNAALGVYFADPITANVITPQPSFFVPNGGGDLYIRGSNTILHNSYVQLQDIGSLAFATAYNTSNVRGAITGLSTINGQGVGEFGGSSWSLYNQVSTLSSITADSGSISSLTVSSFNGTPFAPWYNVPAAGPVEMNENSINNASYIITSNFYTTELNGQYTGADMGKLTMKASTLSIIASTISMLNLSTVNGNSYIDTRSWATVPATVGIDANGKNISNVGTIFANDVTVGNSIVFTNPNGIININDNALIGVSSIQAFTGQSISFANAGLINISSINGYGVSSFANAWISTATTQLDMNNNNIVNANTATANTFLAGKAVLDNISTSGITSFGDTNMRLHNIYSTNIITAVGGAIRTQMDTGGFYGNGVTAVSYVNTPALTGISSINGAKYNAGGWVGNATTDLNMNLSSIANVNDISANGYIGASIVAAGSVTTTSVLINSKQAVTSINTPNGSVIATTTNNGTFTINPDNLFTVTTDIGATVPQYIPVYAGLYRFTNDSLPSQQNMIFSFNLVAGTSKVGRYFIITANQTFPGSLSQIQLRIEGVTKTTFNGIPNNTVITFDAVEGANGGFGFANYSATAILS